MAYNEQTKTEGEFPVTNTIHHTDSTIIELKLETKDGKQETIETTIEHPFMTDSGWVKAGFLRSGDRIKQAGEVFGKVLEARAVIKSQEMYNLTVDEAHTFFVGDGQWLVHNCPSIDLSSDVAKTFAQPGWIKKDLYSELSELVAKGKLPESVLLKMEESLKGFTSGQGATGIKKLDGNKDFDYELKILGEGGAIRLFGNKAENGQIIFTAWKRSH